MRSVSASDGRASLRRVRRRLRPRDRWARRSAPPPATGTVPCPRTRSPTGTMRRECARSSTDACSAMRAAPVFRGSGRGSLWLRPSGKSATVPPGAQDLARVPAKVSTFAPPPRRPGGGRRASRRRGSPAAPPPGAATACSWPGSAAAGRERPRTGAAGPPASSRGARPPAARRARRAAARSPPPARRGRRRGGDSRHVAHERVHGPPRGDRLTPARPAPRGPPPRGPRAFRPPRPRT